jgi:hypothetical protein
VFSFNIWVFTCIWQTLVRPKQNVGQIDLVETFFRVNYFSIIQNFKSETAFLKVFELIKIFSSFKKSQTHTCHDIVCLMVKNFFFKYYSILPRIVLIGVLQRFTTYDFFELKAFNIRLYLYMKSSFCSIIWHCGFNQQQIFFFLEM